ncbi:MAG TPA: N-acetylmuramoyl-L-alanine amidase [Candidatus Limnocylindria bacterium]|jgi:N-acetylmuramoyl-L-alanine amidase|nr:N-acetylmuramoyl-L-alanine amidase [Candidatus Limnocylindria bacterium]
MLVIAATAPNGIEVGGLGLSVGFPATDPRFVPAGAPLGMIGSDPDDPDDPWSAAAPPGGAVVETPGPTASPNATGIIRIPVPKAIPTGLRRVGIQAGHWKTDEVPDELRRLVPQTGALWEGVTEAEINLDIAQRVAVILNSNGIAVDVLPTTVPAGYVADAFVALHGDSDGVGEWSGFKMAHGSRRGPYEDLLLTAVRDSYWAATGLEYDGTHITANMRGYFAFSWSRYRHAVAAHTPAVILEMGYVSHDHDRALMLDEPDRLASGIATGIMRFLDATPRSKIFGQDLVVPAFPSRRPTPTP